MKKIHLTDGQPSDIRLNEQSVELKELVDSIEKLVMDSGLSYVSINKALYLADKGLYMRVITKRND
ncbi:hypothetical protein [Oceanobacillus neutriphilus]|uniref:Uncharacterized protein n=1 Tax=Oceanobacillus neutriphilus TaxID=531815 RepID=A0ABQ2P3Q7_9BACI|nr:hypothetical protein [Oceanobacillus neutriphilus]GGP17431.1 hypothetical protein GCM10011346_52990 [Oceanobacillus neutriphilus]